MVVKYYEAIKIFHTHKSLELLLESANVNFAASLSQLTKTVCFHDCIPSADSL